MVYLDQNQWGALSRWEHDEGGLRAADAAAAAQLAAAVAAKQVVLPASAGHYVETGPLYGERRVRRASTLLVHSRGWQMRNPLHVRVDELRLGLRGQPPDAPGVFGPRADAFYAAATEDASDGGDVPPELVAVSHEMLGVLSLYEAMVDPEALPDIGGDAASANWAQKFERLAAQLKASGARPDVTRRVTHANLLLDMLDDLARAGLSVGLDTEAVILRLTEPNDPVSRMPFVSRVRGILYGRLRNAGQRWEKNDLMDIMFLACAGGYADVVAGERQAIGYLRQAGDVPPGARLATSLAETVEHVRVLRGRPRDSAGRASAPWLPL